MQVYPRNHAIILSDELFQEYGGQVGQSLPVHRNAAYLLAEKQMSDYIGTLLLPITVTGSVAYDPNKAIISTEYGYVSEIHNIRVLNAQRQELWNISGAYAYSYIADDTYGYLRYRDTRSHFSNCYYGTGTPHYLEYVYTAGLPTGTATQPGIILGLVMAAQISLNEMVFPFSNEGVGDVGIEEFSSLQYREKRKPWKNTSFGSSARAAKIAQLVDSSVTKARKAVVFR